MLQLLYDALNVAQLSQTTVNVCARVSEILLILALKMFKKAVIKINPLLTKWSENIYRLINNTRNVSNVR